LDRSPWSRFIPAVGLAGCLLLAAFLPSGSVLAGAAVLVAGALIYLMARWR
jgi:APA family basic amino acid/polyamine antiporter